MSEKISNKSLNRKALISGAFFVIAQLMVRGLSFIATPFYARLVSTEQLGELKTYESYLMIAMPIMTLSLSKSLFRAKFEFPDKYDSYSSAVETLSTLSSVGMFLIIALFFRRQFLSFTDMNNLMFIYLLLYVMADSFLLIFQNHEKQLMRYKRSVLLTTLTMVPATVISILLLYIGNVTHHEEMLIDLRVIGYYTPQIIGGIVVAIALLKSGRCLYNKEYWRFALKFSLPLIPAEISVQIMNQADKVMIRKMVDAQSTGIFAMATTVSFIIWIVQNAVWSAWQPWLFEKLGRNEGQEVKKPWYVIAILFGFISWFLVALSPELIMVLGGSKYKAAIYLVAPMLSGVLYRFYSNIYSSMQHYYKKTQYVAIGDVIVMIANIILNYVCIKFFGYQAAAYTTAVSYMLLMIVQGIMEKKVTGGRIVPLSKMMLIVLLVFGLNVVTMLTFGWNFLLRYVIILVISGVFAVLMWPSLKVILKQLKK